MGGEKRNGTVSVFRSGGSPPRGRGKDRFFSALHRADGITPAWAGKSGFTAAGVTVDQDHPRVGGEKLANGNQERLAHGSPPRGRGKVFLQGFINGINRITPAWAGKSVTTVDTRNEDEDHPRVGGEKVLVPKAFGQ